MTYDLPFIASPSKSSTLQNWNTPHCLYRLWTICYFRRLIQLHGVSKKTCAFLFLSELRQISTAEIVCCIYNFHLTWPTSLLYLVKRGCSDFYPTLDLLQSDCSDVVPKWRGHTFLLRGHCQTWASCLETMSYVFNRTAPQCISTRHRRFSGLKDARDKSSSKRLCPCTSGTFRARILAILSWANTTTNNCA